MLFLKVASNRWHTVGFVAKTESVSGVFRNSL